MEIRARDQARRLVAGAAQEQVAPDSRSALRQFFERAQAGRVERRHVAQPQDDDLRQVVQCRSKIGRSLSVAPNRNGPWMRKILHVAAECACPAGCARGRLCTYSSVTADTVVVSATRLMNSKRRADHADADGRPSGRRTP